MVCKFSKKSQLPIEFSKKSLVKKMQDPNRDPWWPDLTLAK